MVVIYRTIFIKHQSGLVWHLLHISHKFWYTFTTSPQQITQLRMTLNSLSRNFFLTNYISLVYVHCSIALRTDNE